MGFRAADGVFWGGLAQEMPVVGYDTWFKLEPRSSTSKVQGECHLILKRFTNQVCEGRRSTPAVTEHANAVSCPAERHDSVEERLQRLHSSKTADSDFGVRTQSGQSEFVRFGQFSLTHQQVDLEPTDRSATSNVTSGVQTDERFIFFKVELTEICRFLLENLPSLSLWSQREPYNWNGQVCPAAWTVLTHHAVQTDLPPLQQAIM